MVGVSSGWKAVQNEILLPEVFVELTYTVTEPGLQQDATASGNYPEAFANASQIVEVEHKDSEAYAALDYGMWGLDGSFSYSDGSPDNPGYVDANYSSEDGSMSISPFPTITIDFPKRHDYLVPGITITWSKVFGGWATDFRVSTYNSTGLVEQKTITGNTSIESVVDIDLIYYTKITIEVLKWSHPYQRVRCIDIRLGVRKTYTKTDLMKFEHSQSVDLLSAALPRTGISFSLRNDDNRWNPDNPEGTEKYLLEQQEMKVRYGMDINGTVEWIEGGTFWLSEWGTPANGLEATFKAIDAIGFMQSTYTGIRKGTLYDIAVEAFTEAELPILEDGSVRYVLDDSLKSVETDFSEDDSEYSISEVLQMVANVGCCVFYQDRSGVVHIEPWRAVYSGYLIDNRTSYAHPEYTINKPLKSVSVAYGKDLRATVTASTKGEVQKVDNPLIVTESDAIRVGEHAKEFLIHRKVISGEFRADMRLDALDNIIVTSKYASNIIAVSDIKYATTGGAFKGTYTGRVVSVELTPTHYHSGEIYAGEV
jgi:hypothetical protein